MIHPKCRAIHLPWAFLAAAVATCILAVPVHAQDGRSAAWTQQKFRFTVLGFQTRYSCFGLHDTIRRILLDLGARRSDLEVDEVDCGLRRPPSIEASFWVLEPIAPDAPKVLNGAVATVTAHFQEVEVRFGRGGLEISACELAHQVVRQIVPYFTARNARFDPDCVENQIGTAAFALRADVLMPDGAGAPARRTIAPISGKIARRTREERRL